MDNLGHFLMGGDLLSLGLLAKLWAKQAMQCAV